MTDKTIAFVLYPGLTPLDLIGPLQVMSGLETVEETFDARNVGSTLSVSRSVSVERSWLSAYREDE